MTDNRTNGPTEAQVEAAAKALEKLPLNLITRVEALDAARAALVAAQGAAPVLPSIGVDEGKLAEVIRKEMAKGAYQMLPDELPYASSAARVTRAVVEAIRGECQ